MLRMREVKPRAAKTHPKPQKEKPAAGGSVGDAEDGQSPNKHDPEKWYPLATEFEKHRKELFGTLGNSLPISLGQLSRQSGLDGFGWVCRWFPIPLKFGPSFRQLRNPRPPSHPHLRADPRASVRGPKTFSAKQPRCGRKQSNKLKAKEEKWVRFLVVNSKLRRS